MTNLTQFFGGDDPIAYLRCLAEYLRTSLGLQAARSVERLIEDLLAQDAQQQLRLRDLHRDTESLEDDLRRARGY